MAKPFVLLSAGLLLAAVASAKPEYLAPASELGAKDCLFCHTNPAGGKEWNARGLWLVDQKQQRGGEEIVVDWLEEYQPSGQPEQALKIEGPLNIPETFSQGPFFQPNPDPDALWRWLETRGRYSTAGGEWPQYAGDTGSSKYSPLDQIDAGNVARLRLAWTWDAFDNSNFISADLDPRKMSRAERRRRLPDPFKATPLMINGKLFIRTNFSGVAAIRPSTGETLWTYDPGTAAGPRPGMFGFATRGLAYWSSGDEQRILLCTSDSYLVALDPETGKPLRDFGDNGRTDLTKGSRRPLNRALINCSAPPVIVGDVAIVGNQIADGPPGRSPASGGEEWRENWPVGDVRGYDVRTGKKVWTFHTVPQQGEYGVETWGNHSWRWMGNTNVWSMMSSDEKLGYVYLPVTGPTFNFAGEFRPGENLFSNSIVCLDAKTGKRVWHFQTIHHDIWDWDLPAAPNLIDITVDGERIPALAQVTKVGFLYVFDRRTGEPIWPIEERPVPASEFEETSATQPVPTKPPPFELQGLTEADLLDFTPGLKERALAAVEPHRLGPLFTPPSEEGTIQMPSWGGGGNWGGAGYDPETGYLYVSSRRAYITVGMQPAPDGEKLGYKHVQKFFQAAVNGLPVHKPPYGTITAYDMNRGEIAWQIPQGRGPKEHPLFKDLDLPDMGNANASGVLVTRTLLFTGDIGSAHADAGASFLRAYDKANGETLWESELPGKHSYAPPMTYLADGKQYVVIAVGGATQPARLVAYALE